MAVKASSVTIACFRLERVIDLLRSMDGEAQTAIAAGLRSWAEQTATEAKRRCPVDTGALHDSIFVEQDTNKSSVQSVVTIGAGGPAAPYAVDVHDNLDPKVRWKVPGTGPKFIENPVNERMGELDSAIAAELEAVLEKFE